MINNIFGSKKVLEVLETNNGVLTYCNMNRLEQFNEAYRNQLKAFLQGALDKLNKLDNTNKPLKQIDNKKHERSMGELIDK